MILFPSNKTAVLMNKTLANVSGTTTTSDGAASNGLICSEDLSNFVQCGQAINTALTKTPELFFNAVTGMLQTVADIFYEVISSDEYKLNRYDLQVSSSEFACLKEKVRIDTTEFEAAFVLDGLASSTFNDLFAKHPFTFNVKVWGNKGIYRTKPFTISYEMYKTSVQSRNGWDRIVAEMWAVINAVTDIAVSQSPYFLIKQQIANAALYRNGIRVEKIDKLYTAETNKPFTSADDPDFAAWFVKHQRHERLLLRRVTNKFSGKENIKMNTPEAYTRRFLLDDFYDNVNKGLSGVYHDNKIGNIDDYELEPYIENVNEPNKLDIVPANPPILSPGKHVTRVEIDGIVGMIWDKRGTFWSTEYKKIAANDNTFDDHVNYISTVAAQHCVDEDSNVIVYIIGDNIKITEENDV